MPINIWGPWHIDSIGGEEGGVKEGTLESVQRAVRSMLRPHIIRDLELPKHGLEIIPLEASFSPLPGGDSLCRWGDPHPRAALVLEDRHGGRGDVARGHVDETVAFGHGDATAEVPNGLWRVAAASKPRPGSSDSVPPWTSTPSIVVSPVECISGAAVIATAPSLSATR